MLRLARATEWLHLRSYVSGAFFDVLPAATIASELKRLSAHHVQRRRFEARREELAQAWASARPAIVVSGASLPGPPLSKASPAEAERHAIGHSILTAFFRTVLDEGDPILDLRAGRMAWYDDTLHWRPGRLWTHWNPSFRAALRDLYTGFYDNDPDRFEGALEELRLGPAEEVMRNHFGGDDQRNVAFDLGQFHATFHEVFVACRESGAALDGGFVGLGVLLGCLYETLEGLGGTYDVRAAFHAAQAQ